MAGFLGTKEVLSRQRVKEIFRNKEYSYLEEKIALMGSEGGFGVVKNLVPH